MKIPGFLLRRLYVKNSLSIIENGFEFQLRNQLGSGYAHRVLPMKLDDQDIDLASTSFEVDGKEIKFSQVTRDNPFTLAMNKSTTVRVKGILIDSSLHNIEMSFEVAGLGVLSFDFSEFPRVI